MAVVNPTAAGESNEVDLSDKLATREVPPTKNTSHLVVARDEVTGAIRLSSESAALGQAGQAHDGHRHPSAERMLVSLTGCERRRAVGGAGVWRPAWDAPQTGADGNQNAIRMRQKD